MPNSSPNLWNEIRRAAAKWYASPLVDLIRKGRLEPLPAGVQSSNEHLVRTTPVIAYPTPLEPQSTRGVDPQLLSGIFFSPFLIRLNYIAQLSTTYMRANIDAKHCRLGHALGALSVFSSLTNRLISRIDESPDIDSRCIPTETELVSAMFYVAIHDAFQGPFGHTLDALREELIGGLHKHRRLDKTLLCLVLRMASKITPAGESQAPKGVQAFHNLAMAILTIRGYNTQNILRWMYQASLEPGELDSSARRRRQEIGWLHELIEGPLDADRWDYLWRDTLHLGRMNENRILQDLLNHFKDRIDIHWDGSRSRLLLDESLASQIGKNFFGLRKTLYIQFYENPEKRLIDNSLVRCIHLSLLEPLRASTHEGMNTGQQLEHLIDFINITDSELLALLERNTKPGLSRLIAYLARELNTYPAVSVAWEKSLREVEHEKVIAEQNLTLEKFKQQGVYPTDWVQEIQSQAADSDTRISMILNQTWERLTKGVRDSRLRSPMTLLLHCSILPIRQKRLMQLERIVWRLTTRRLKNSEILTKVQQAMGEAILKTLDEHISGDGPALEEISPFEDVIRVCPPVFASFPWVSSVSTGAMTEMLRAPREDEFLIRRADNSHIASTPGDLIPYSPDAETYIAVAGYPLFASRYLNNEQDQEFSDAIHSSMESAVRHGIALAIPKELTGPEYDDAILAWLSSPKQV